MWGTAAVIEYNSSCLRYLLVASKSRPPQIDPAFMAVGAHHEDWYAAQLGSRLADRELVIKSEVLPGVEYSGRCDFVDTDGVVHETKGTFSASALSYVINKGKYKTSHLAQLVSYLTQLHKTQGVIAVGFYMVDEDGKYVQRAFREFKVSIQDDGSIYVDNEPSGFTVADQLAHRYQAAQALKNQTIADRPLNHNGFNSPCNFCPLKSVCNDYDAKTIDKDELITQGIKAINEQVPMKANPKKVGGKRVQRK